MGKESLKHITEHLRPFPYAKNGKIKDGAPKIAPYIGI